MIICFISLFGLIFACVAWILLCLFYFFYVGKKKTQNKSISGETSSSKDIMAFRPPFTIKLVMANEEESVVFSDNVVKLSELLQGRLEAIHQDRVGELGKQVVKAEKKMVSETMYEGAKPDDEPDYEEIPEMPDLDFMEESPQQSDDDELADLSLAI